MDAASGFWQIPLDSECVKLTPFITPFGRYCFNRLPFGITSAPEIFQFKMNELLEGLEGVVVYMDDILVYGSNMKEHDERLSKVLHVLKENGLKLNDSKCHYHQSELKFLVQSISKDGVGISRDKVAAIQNLAPPTNVTELKRALGMINYRCSYIDQLCTVLKPLNDLLKCDVYWFCGPEQDAAFAKVKDLISTVPVLAYFDPTKSLLYQPMLVAMVSEVFCYSITVKSCVPLRSRRVLYPKPKRDTHKSRNRRFYVQTQPTSPTGNSCTRYRTSIWARRRI